MKLLFDQNVSFKVVTRISDFFPNAKQIKDFNLVDKSDFFIWNFAKENDWTVVTFDRDFFKFSVLHGHPPKIIWLRLKNQTSSNIETVLRKHFEDIGLFLSQNELSCLQIDS